MPPRPAAICPGAISTSVPACTGLLARRRRFHRRMASRREHGVPEYDSFLLRVWRSRRRDGWEWVLRLEHLQGEERQEFDNPEALVEALWALVEAQSASKAEPSHIGSAGEVSVAESAESEMQRGQSTGPQVIWSARVLCATCSAVRRVLHCAPLKGRARSRRLPPGRTTCCVSAAAKGPRRDPGGCLRRGARRPVPVGAYSIS